MFTIVSVAIRCDCCHIKIVYYSRDRWGNLNFVYEEHERWLDSHNLYGFDPRPKLVEFPQDRILS